MREDIHNHTALLNPTKTGFDLSVVAVVSWVLLGVVGCSSLFISANRDSDIPQRKSQFQGHTAYLAAVQAAVTTLGSGREFCPLPG